MLCNVAPEDSEWRGSLDRAMCMLTQERSVAAFAKALGLERGVTGYAYHTVPVSIYAWLRHWGDFKTAIEAVLNCGGDTDTAGAITGALVGTVVGEEHIPPEWINGIVDWPLSIDLLREAAEKLARQREHEVALGRIGHFWPGTAIRNAAFLLIVLIHAIRRLLPPY
jgi:hypothetical protein